MTKIVEINYCTDCPWRSSGWWLPTYCVAMRHEKHPTVHYRVADKIPEWCPLPDKQDKWTCTVTGRLRNAARVLAILCLQTPEYYKNLDIRDAVDNVIALTKEVP